ncbi:neuromusculin isoform X4 [Megalopta genalis]|uniref:neuromusculin isoform X4 n=1 Tax=Megalopta genalis TaxID=115081 RepID=UPI0014430D76|nr:hemicentin-1 isoform X4 [Megalopta genalis]
MADGLGHRRNRGTPANILLMVLAALHILHAVEGSNEPWLKSEKRAELGTEVELPCVLKSPQCNGLHSIKWYRDATRIIIFSEKGGTTRGNDDIAARSNIEYTKNMTTSYLKITDVKIEDEGLYKCEATYLTVNRKCNNVHHIMLNVTVHPKSVRVIDESTKSPLSTGTTLGPINEGSMISLYCESGEGKPVPSVEWYKDDQLLEATNSTTIGDNGIGTASSLLQMQITREELGATFTCKVNSTALVEPLTVDIKLDVHVRPLKMDLNGVVGHVVRGTNILLQCTVRAARPAANVTWQNGTEYLESNDRFEMFETKVQENNDSTSETISYLAFTATEYDNGRTFKCYAENSVTRYENLEPMKESTTIEVLYPPTVRMRPQNITVNETEDILIFCDYEANPATLTNVTWLRDDKKITLTEDHYEGGITEQTALTVKNATASDMGTYKCILDNKVGTSVSDDVVEVNVLYKPVVEVIMDPDTPVNEADRLNVSLTCEVVSGNPASLTAVRWYLNGDLLKELPDCTRNSTATTTSTEDLCDIDPSKLLLQAVDREFHGNCSCEGRNDAGWGPLSPSAPVIVYYKPGPASISYEPQRVIKKESLNITCSVQDPGLPKVVGFKWFRGLHRLPDANNATLTIGSVNLETEANFTCLAYNEAGDGDPATTFIDVSAAPAFINKLPSYRGFVYNASNVNITCWVECAPICNISWLKTNTRIDFTKTNRYYVLNVYYPPDPRKNDFESIQSTLVWNLTAWPGGQLDRAEDNVEFTCRSSDNGIGEAINSSTHVHVEFPPENVTISKKIVNVTVDTIPETVTCNANSHPKPAYRWLREGSNDTIMEGRFLDLKVPAPRRSNGTYYCEVRNRHGSRTIAVVLNVQFKPECHVEKEQIDGKDYVVCSAIANPRETDFVWSLKNDNDTLEQVAEIRNGKSYMRLDTSVTNFRTYICVVNNTIGYSNPCERDVPDPNQAANNNHVNSVSEGLPESGAKTFYENLPFHGIQAPPNKLVSPMFARVSALHGTLHHSIVAAACGGGGGSQPLSRTTSFCDASSGYESTRSHLGPHYSDYNMPRSNSPVPRYNSLKPRRRKHKRSQFYSLRLCRRHEAAQNRKYQLYAIPIYKCPHKNSSTSTLATIVTPDTPSSTNRRSPDSSSRSDLAVKETAAGPPVPAPRRSRKTDPSKHTYQNVPLPVFPPKNASLPKTKLDLATYVATVLVYVGRASSKFSLTQPPSDTQSRAYERARLRTDSLYNYKEHYQQQHRQEMQQYSYPLPSNSSSQLTLPLTRSLYHSSIVSPLQNSFVHANNRPSTLPHHETVNHLSAVHPDEDQQNYTNHDGARQPRRHASRGNERGQKYRKHKRADRKSKQRRGERACETSFHQVQELGIPETCKIAYPHYYEDNIAECPTEYHRLNPAARQQIWERRSNRSQGESTYYADPGGDTKTRNKSKNRLSSSSNLGDGRSPSAPTIMQYADLHFRDVGQEIDV